MAEIFKVIWGKRVDKALLKLPEHIQLKFSAWVTAIKLVGLRKIRERAGFHDEPLSGNRQGQRSVRLNNQYRIFYVEDELNEHIEVIEVNKHEY